MRTELRVLRVSRAAAARVVEQLVRERNDDRGIGGLGALAQECHVSHPDVSVATFQRTIHRVLTGKATSKTGKQYIQRTVSYETVDLILTAVDRPDLWYSDELRRWGAARPAGTQPRRYKSVRPESKMTLAQIRAAHELYLDGKSLRVLGRELCERYGYASARSCANSLSEAFIREGLPRRDRIEACIAASSTHGMARREKRKANTLDYRVLRKRQRIARGEARGVKCCALVDKQGRCIPRPCRNAALAGGDYCHQHDPVRRDRVIAMAANARAHLPQLLAAA